MGFPSAMAAQALSAGGGDLLKATDWLLNPPPNHSPPPSNSTPPNIQPKINQFFHLHTNKNQTHQEHDNIDGDEDSPPLLLHRKKRQKSAEIYETTQKPSAAPPPHAPLSERMRPRVLDEVVGQDHLLGKDSLLRSAIACGRLPSFVLWGPPGTGKTSIARAIANSSPLLRFVPLSAVTSGVKDVRDAVDAARKSKTKRTILFIDESTASQIPTDSFLPAIEDGSIIFWFPP
ncbi:PREDICTED: ATPase WRNIP1 [Erythranthe guttata]|uniref:ATPase WRNIP1 n=1 Tax=Erythranthe guttata TaxID=4155 RepID=UPI00064DDEE7|nr:PREDICTED: ATPase WRNIP1 [Erythranthe guttata]|eukprot:XP_012830763.1 PREDICTED: ATPase WRNIP1 [Erythranthe guttata]